MASLSDQIDRFSRSTKAIKATASQTALPRGSFGVAGLFTRAVLHTQLGNLIRDIDPSELGLFQLTTSPQPFGSESVIKNPACSGVAHSGVARIEFGSTTPLRRITLRHNDPTKFNIEPEIYARAAMQYIDKYDPIRAMPRARSQATAIIQQLGDIRQNVGTLLHTLEHVKSEDIPPLKSLQDREEERMMELKVKIANLKQRRHASLARKKSMEREVIIRTSVNPSFHEEASPVSAARILHFTDNPKQAINNMTLTSVADHDLDTSSFSERPPSTGENPQIEEFGETVANHNLGKVNDAKNTLCTDQVGIDMLQLQSLSSDLTGCNSGNRVANNFRIRMNLEVELITNKIWNRAADIFGPVSPSNNSGSYINEAPCASDTLAQLELLSRHEVPQTSTEVATETLQHPTTQQILTAYFFLTLLSESPHYSMPLNKVKGMLAAKMGGKVTAAVGQVTSRIIYGCVAKRLVKIDRSGREHIVKFDI